MHQTNTYPSASGSGRQCDEYAVRDRVLLYLRGLGVGTIASLEIASECLRRAGPGASHAVAMAALRELLRDHGLLPGSGQTVGHFRSFPTFRRTIMIAGRMHGSSIAGATRRLVRRLMGRGRPSAGDGRRKEA